MGLIFAGDLRDVALATRAELEWAACLAIQRSHGFERFWRFRDDSLTIATDGGLANAFFQGYAQRCGYFRAGVEDISHTTVKFLDVRIIKNPGKYVIVPWFKDSMMCNHPLACDSAHPPRIHSSWPVMQVRRLGRLCNDVNAAEWAKEKYISRFENHFAPTALIKDMRATRLTVGQFMLSQKGNSAAGPANIWWLPLGYHPLLREPIRAVLAKINKDPALRALLGFIGCGWQFMQLRVAWANRLPTMQRVLLALHDK